MRVLNKIKFLLSIYPYFLGNQYYPALKFEGDFNIRTDLLL